MLELLTVIDTVVRSYIKTKTKNCMIMINDLLNKNYY
jgi:hypothetical protein